MVITAQGVFGNENVFKNMRGNLDYQICMYKTDPSLMVSQIQDR